MAMKKQTSLDPTREWSLDETAPYLPDVKASALTRVRDAVLAAQTDEELVALGSGYKTEDILAAVPGFIVGTVLALEVLGKAPRGLAPALVPLLHGETKVLFAANTAFEDQSRGVGARMAERRAELKEMNSRGLDERRNAARVLRTSVLPAKHKARAAIDRAAARADTPAATVASVRAIAEVIEKLREEADLRALLDEYGYDAVAVRELRELADQIESLSKNATGLTPPVQMSQSALDRQDGIVLTLLRAIWIPLRDARERGAAITLPPLGAVARLVARPSREAEDPAEPAEPAPEPS